MGLYRVSSKEFSARRASHEGKRKRSASGLAGELGSYGFSCQPEYDCNHSAPSNQTDHTCNGYVVLQHAQAGENCVPVVLHKIRIARGHQRKHHGARVGHVSGRVEPVFEKEKRAEDKRTELAVEREVSRKQEWHQPLQDRAAPQADGRSEPAEEQMPAFVYH